MKFPTRNDKIVDLFYCSIKESYVAYKKPPLGMSDHNMMYLLPKYRQLIKRKKSKEIIVTKWSRNGVDALRGCFDATDWSVFQVETGEHDIVALTDYINSCFNSIIPSKSVKCFQITSPG